MSWFWNSNISGIGFIVRVQNWSFTRNLWFVVGLLYLKHDRKKAEAVYTQLLDRNPENGAYYKGLENALQPGKNNYLWAYCDTFYHH